jgi:spore coat protein CotH
MTKVRDAYMTRIVAGHVELETMAVRNCVVYVNGEYYGLYEIREKLDQFYVASHFGVDPDKVDMIKGTSAVVSGSNADYKELIAYAKAHSMNDPAAYKKVLDWVDEESLMDFVIVQSFFSNPDSGNKKFWRPAVEGGEYRYMLFDLDWALFPSTYDRDRLKGDLLDPAGHGQGNAFSTTLQVKLMENPEFEKIFVERYANFLNTIFKTDRMLKILDENVAIVEPEMARQIARWGQPSSMNSWKNMVATLRRITSEKRGS